MILIFSITSSKYNMHFSKCFFIITFDVYLSVFQIRLMQETCERILEYESSRHGM